MVKEKKLTETIEDSFSRYAGSVILDRAICDVRDMVKPAARMLLYSQLKVTKNTNDKPFIKSARVVGDALGHFYSHGDSSCYGTYMRMAKPFAMRYPLEECQGNSGTVITTGDEAAARYTGLRLAKCSHYLYDGLNKNAIDKWTKNFDETEELPNVFPSVGFYNIVNGTTGIGVALASSIPQFNLKEVNAAIIKLIYNPKESFDNIVCFPDFATGATILNKSEVRESLKTGTGKACCIRATIEYIPNEHSLHVSNIPYGVYTSTITGQIKELMEENPEYGVENIIDASGKTPDYTIYLSKSANPKTMIKKLYHDTSLEDYYSINMVMLRDGRFPQVFGWHEALLNHITHAKECYHRELQYDRDILLARQNIISGLLQAIANIDEVVAIIHGANDVAAAKAQLRKKFSFNEKQIKAILDLKLQRLVKLDGIKLKEEYDDNQLRIDEYDKLLTDTESFNKALAAIYQQVSDEFGDARRTKVIDYEEHDEPEQEQEQIEFYTYVLSTGELALRKTQVSRFTKGIPLNCFTTTNSGHLVCFTKDGKSNIINLNDKEVGKNYPLSNDIVLVESPDTLSACKYLVFFTRNGTVKRSAVSEYNFNSNRALVAIKLRDGDEVIKVCPMGEKEEDYSAIIYSSSYQIRFTTKEIPSTGRATIGVKGINLKEGEQVQDAELVLNSSDCNVPLSIRGGVGRKRIS